MTLDAPETSSTPEMSWQTMLTVFSMVTFMLVCGAVVVPIAAWDHNVLLIIVAVLVPKVLWRILSRLGKLPASKKEPRDYIKSELQMFARAAVTVFLFWNHLWVIALVLFVISMVVIIVKSYSEAKKKVEAKHQLKTEINSEPQNDGSLT